MVHALHLICDRTQRYFEDVWNIYIYFIYISSTVDLFITTVVEKKSGLQLNNKLAYDEFKPISILEQKLLAYSS